MINLKKNQGIELEDQDLEGKIKVTLLWKTAIDLDLHCIAESRTGKKEHVYFGQKSGRFAKLDQDAGIGDRAGSNKETMELLNFKEVKNALFYIELFGKDNLRFDEYQAKLLINFSGKPIAVDVEDKNKGKYFVIGAIVDGSMINVNYVTSKTPTIESVLKHVKVTEVVDKTGSVISSVTDAGKGVLRKIGSFLSKF